MYITQFEITDLRCFKGTHTVSLDRGDGTYAGWTVIAGRNGAGKTSLLRALALAVIGPDAARGLVSTFPKWVRDDCQAAEAGTLLIPHLDQDGFKKGGTISDVPFWTTVRWNKGEATDSVEAVAGKNEGRPQVASRGPWSEESKGWFIAGYGAARRLGPTTAEVVKKRINPALDRLVNLYDESATLNDGLDWLKEVHTKALENRSGYAELKQSVINLLNDGLLPPGSAVEKFDADGLWITRDGVSLVLDQVSDGYRVVAALVLELLRLLYKTYHEKAKDGSAGRLICDLPGVVLIDEVDAHLHVEWQQRIGFWLTRHFPNLQFLVTTHSPFICQAASPRGIIRLPAPGEDRRIEVLEGRDFTQVVGGGADSAVRGMLFGLEHAHSQPAEDVRKQLAELERKLLLDQATPEDLEKYEELKATIPDNLGEVAARRRRAVVGEP